MSAEQFPVDRLVARQARSVGAALRAIDARFDPLERIAQRRRRELAADVRAGDALARADAGDQLDQRAQRHPALVPVCQRFGFRQHVLVDREPDRRRIDLVQNERDIVGAAGVCKVAPEHLTAFVAWPGPSAAPHAIGACCQGSRTSLPPASARRFPPFSCGRTRSSLHGPNVMIFATLVQLQRRVHPRTAMPARRPAYPVRMVVEMDDGHRLAPTRSTSSAARW